MSVFNVLRLTCLCHSCGTPRDLELQFRYGRLCQKEYRVGSMLDWTGRGWDGVPYQGYVLANANVGDECPACDNEDDYLIVIRAGRIIGVIPYVDVVDEGSGLCEFWYATGEMELSTTPNEADVVARSPAEPWPAIPYARPVTLPRE